MTEKVSSNIHQNGGGWGDRDRVILFLTLDNLWNNLNMRGYLLRNQKYTNNPYPWVAYRIIPLIYAYHMFSTEHIIQF